MANTVSGTPPAIKLTTGCYVMPLFDNATLDEQLRVVGKSVLCQTPEDKFMRSDFKFDHVYSNQHEFAKLAYSSIMGPLVKRAIEGDSTMVIFGGLQSMKLNHFLLSQTVMQGLISQAAGQLLHSVNNKTEKLGSVTFSWYNIGCGGDEGLVDVLKTASSSQQSMGNSQSSSSPTLILREAGKGRNMVVPGLWEVEISSGGDIENVVNHVTKLIPDTADHSSGAAHTVMQLTVTNRARAMTSTTRSLTSSGMAADPPGTGRVVFLLLSNLAASDTQLLNTTSRLPMSPSSSRRQSYAWVDQLHSIVQWLEARRASPPFHKSRLLLLLKEALMRRQRAALLLLVHPSADQHVVNTEWLRLCSAIAKDFTLSPPPNGTSSLKRSASAGRLQQPNSSDPRTVAALTGTNTTTTRRMEGNSDAESMASKRDNAMRRLDMSALAGAGNGDTDLYSSLPIPPPSTHSSNLGCSQLEVSPLPRTAMQVMETNANPNTIGIANLGNGNVMVSNANANTGYVEDWAQREHDTALTLALEASRNEAAALRVAYEYAHSKYKETKREHDALLEQLQEEGSTLSKRDKERYRNALKDLKDYAIYKEVMEAAMMRLQNELEAVVRDNQELRSHRHSDEARQIRQKSYNEKYAKDLVATKKRLSEMEAKMAALEKSNKALARERDAAVMTLAQVQTTSHQKYSHAQDTLTHTVKERDEATRLCKALEEKCRQLEAEKEAMMGSHERDSQSLRTAHSKALETLLNYQQENDALRSAVLELSGDSQQGSADGSSEGGMGLGQVARVVQMINSRKQHASDKTLVASKPQTTSDAVAAILSTGGTRSKPPSQLTVQSNANGAESLENIPLPMSPPPSK